MHRATLQLCCPWHPTLISSKYLKRFSLRLDLKVCNVRFRDTRLFTVICNGHCAFLAVTYLFLQKNVNDELVTKIMDDLNNQHLGWL